MIILAPRPTQPRGPFRPAVTARVADRSTNLLLRVVVAIRLSADARHFHETGEKQGPALGEAFFTAAREGPPCG